MVPMLPQLKKAGAQWLYILYNTVRAAAAIKGVKAPEM
jgi:hypothetical protein